MKRRKFLNNEVLTPRMIEDIRLAKIAEANRQEAIKADKTVMHEDRLKRWAQASYNNAANNKNRFVKR